MLVFFKTSIFNYQFWKLLLKVSNFLRQVYSYFADFFLVFLLIFVLNYKYEIYGYIFWKLGKQKFRSNLLPIFLFFIRSNYQETGTLVTIAINNLFKNKYNEEKKKTTITRNKLRLTKEITKKNKFQENKTYTFSHTRQNHSNIRKI